MGPRRRIYEQLIFILAFLIAVPLQAVTVPICPTNKIAPHRRRHITNWDFGKGRTLGAFYDLLAPNSLQFQNDAPPLNDLQEKPQEDEPDDCGEIEDYDENDLSSITPQYQRRQGQDKTFFPGMYRPPHNYPTRPPSTNRPQRPQRPTFPNYPPTRPPYWSGGFFGFNQYRPPSQHYPSDQIKPIHENSEDFQAPYRPGLVGGPSGHIVGASPARPTTTNYEATTSSSFFPNRTPRNDPQRTSRPFYQNRIPQSTPSPNIYPIRGQRPRNINSNGLFGSFVDLLFK